MHGLRVSLILSVLSFLLAIPVEAQVPEMIGYQGVLADSADVPLDGSVTMTFSIYETEGSETPLWTETHDTVVVTGGVFHVELGSIDALKPDSFPPGSSRWLGVQVEDDEEMSPRQRLISVPYALRAQDADSVAGQVPILGIAGVASDTGSIDLTAGTNIVITPNDATNTINIAVSGLGLDADMLDGQHHTYYQNATNINAGFLGEAYLPQNAIDSSEVEDNSLAADDLAVDVVSSLDGVTSDGSDIDLLAGDNISITPDAVNHTILIEADEGPPDTRCDSSGVCQSIHIDDLANTNNVLDTSAQAGPANTLYWGNRAVATGQVVASLDGVSNDGGNVDLIAGSGITVTPDDGANTITLAATFSGNADTLDGQHGSYYQNATNINAGAIGEAYLPQGAIDSSEIEDNTLAAIDLSVNVVSSLDTVSNDGGNIDLIPGSGMSISSDDTANTITLAVSTTANADTLDSQHGSYYQNATNINAGAIGEAFLPQGVIDSSEIEDGSLAAIDLAVNVVSSLDGVINDGGDIDLLAGANTTITPNDGANTITLAATIVSTETSAVTTITTTSATWTNLSTDLTRTPGVAGTYLVIFSSAVSSGSADTIDVGLAVDNAVQTNSVRRVDSNNNGEIIPIGTQAILTLTATNVVRVQWQTGGGTASMYQRTLTVIRLQ
jgi:hypothetical protein